MQTDNGASVGASGCSLDRWMSCDAQVPEDQRKGERRDHTAIDVESHQVVSFIVGKRDRDTLAAGAGGLHATCAELVAADVHVIAAQLRAVREVLVAPHLDGPRVKAHIQSFLAATRERPSRDP
ncbi:MAG: hypothetical protein HYV63_22815 [Candidatus Schekmanbacteria bacterium]|nr:hypothetical protein [Candidatus Schekmanbacteria bacterium]